MGRIVRVVRYLLAGSMVLALIAVLAALPLTVFPESVAIPRDVDAVVVLAGGDGERIATARALMERQVGPPADVLLLSDPDPGDPNPLCGVVEADYSVRCVVPDPVTTAGEAEVIGALIDAERWDRVALVTTTSHLTRSRLRFARCTDAELVMVAATPQLGAADRIASTFRELAALSRDALDGGAC
jgi:uncharacterized SAM-binding protein YcdF (DUF218 family)